MNKIYRIIWNAAKGAWQVSSELSARKGKAKARASRLLDAERGAVAGRKVSRRQPALARSGSALALESRMLLDAAGATTALDAVGPVMDPAGQTTELVVDEALVSALWELDTASNDGDYAAAAVPVAATASTEESLLTDAGTSERARELVFIDTSIDNYQALVDATRDGVEVILLDADRDGLQQIADYVAGRSDIDAIHILSHGAEGEKRIGSTVLNADNLASYSEVLGQIGASLSANGDILLYGCHVASGDGTVFIDDLARLTGADVAASDDLTANADRGGNWVLEYETGSIESTLPFDAVALAAFEGVLAVPVITDPGAIGGLEDTAGIDLFGPGAVTSPDSNTMEAVVTVISGEGLLDTGALSLAEVASQGDRASINSFLADLKFVPAADWNGTATIRVVVEADYANRGETSTLELTVTVTPISDAPLGTSIAVTAAEDSPYVITAADFGFSDPADAVFGATADNFTEVRITTLPSAARGSLTLNGADVNAGQIVSLVDLNAGILQFEPAQNGFGNNYASFTFQVRDSGSPDNGGVVEDPTPKTFTFNVTPVNDAPATVEAALNVDKNGALTFNLTSFDPDTGTNATTDAVVTQYRLVSVPANGVLSQGGTTLTAGSFVAAQAPGANPSVNPSLALTFTPDENFTGDVTLVFVARDAAGAESGESTLAITVNEKNEAPIITVPGPQTLAEDSAIALNGINITDPDAAGGVLQLTLSSTNGTVTLSSLDGLFSDPEGTTATNVASGASLTVYGTLANLNTAVTGLVYTPNADFFGAAAVTLTVNDLGNTGPLAESDIKTINLTVTNVPDSPVTGNASLAPVLEDTQSPSGARISALLSGFVDVDGDSLAGIAIGSNAANQATEGVWQYSLNNRVTWQDVGAVSTGAALLLPANAHLRFVPVANYYGEPAPLTIHAVDNSASESITRNFTADPASRLTLDAAVAASDIDNIGAPLTTSITSVNDVFVVVNDNILQALEGNDGGSSALLTRDVLEIVDVEAAPEQIVYTMIETGSVLGDGVFQRFDGTNWVDLAFGATFTQADINAGAIRYFHNGDEPLGTERLVYSVTDLVAGGGGTAEERVLEINVTPVNDSPLLYVPGNTVPADLLAGAEDMVLTAIVPVQGSLTFGTHNIFVFDPDNTDEQLVFRLESLPTVGVLRLNGNLVGVGSVFNYGDLALLTYTHTGSTDGIDAFSVTLRDGAGGQLGATVINLQVGGVNLAPSSMGNVSTWIWEDAGTYPTASSNVGFAQVNTGRTFADWGFGFTDANTVDTLGGYAIVGGTSSAGGDWQYSTDAGTIWYNMGAVSNTSALILAPDTLVRFSPAQDFFGLAPTLQIRVMDSTYNASNALYNADGFPGFTSGDTPVLLSVSAANAGGNTAVSDTVNTFSMEVRAVNDDPVLENNLGLGLAATSDDSASFTGTITSAMLRVTDVDSLIGALAYTLTAAPSNGTVFRDGQALGVTATFTQADIDAGIITYRLAPGAYPAGVVDSFQFQVRDGSRHIILNRPGGIYDNGTLETLTFNISLANDLVLPEGSGGSGEGGLVGTWDGSPITRNDSYAINRNLESVPSALTVTGQQLTANDSWQGTRTLSLTNGSGNPVNGTVTYNAGTDTFVFTPTQGFVGSASFQYTLTDDADPARTSTGTVFVEVLFVNAVPTIEINNPLQSNEGAQATIDNTLLQLVDFDGDSIYITLTSLPANGQLYLGSVSELNRLRVGNSFTQAHIDSGQLIYVHDDSEDFISSFGFEYTDGGGEFFAGQFNFDITPVNDQPVLNTDSSFLISEGGHFFLNVNATDSDGGGDKDPATASEPVADPLAAINTLTFHFLSLPINGEIRLVNVGQTYDPKNADTYAVLDLNSVIAYEDRTRLVYQHNDSETPSDSFQIRVDDSAGQINSSSTTATVSITVLAVNDDPVVTDNTDADIVNNDGSDTHNPPPPVFDIQPFNAYEGANTVIAAEFLNSYDPDNSDTQLQFSITRTVSNGALLLNGVQVLGIGSRVTQDDINEGRLSYRHNGSETLQDSFDFRLSDGGGGLEPTGTFTITVLPVNDAPVVTLPTPRTAVEDQPLAITGISIGDADALAGDILELTLSAANGTVRLTTFDNLFSDAGGDNALLTAPESAVAGSITVYGTVSALNAALAGLVYQGALDFNSDDGRGPDSLTLTVNDRGNNGTDPDSVAGLVGDGVVGSETTIAALSINVLSVNDAPVISGPVGLVEVNEDTPLMFSLANVNALTVSDVDAGTAPLQVTLSMMNGRVTLAGTEGLTIVNGLNSSSFIVFTGSLADINAALDGLTYQAFQNYFGTDTFRITVNDLGNSGELGGPESAQYDQVITINPVNDAPTAENMSFTGQEDTILAVVLESDDVDSDTDPVTDAVVDRYRIDTLPANGVLQYLNSGVWEAVTAAQVLTKAQGENLRFVPNANFHSGLGNAFFTFTAIDQAGAESATRTATLAITAVNDAPELSGGGDSVTYTEGSGLEGSGTPVILDANSDIALFDRELTEQSEDTFAGATVTVQRQGAAVGTDRFGVDEANGVSLSGTTISVSGTAVATVSNDSSGGTLVITFNANADKAAADAVMRSITFASVAKNLAGVITVSMVFKDGNSGAQGSGGALNSNTLNFTVTVFPVNDSPEFTGNGLLTMVEDLATNNGATISSLMAGNFLDADDPLPGSSFAGAIVIGDNTVRNTHGYWQFSTDSGATWADVNPVSDTPSATNGLALSNNTLLRFVPVLNFNTSLMGNLLQGLEVLAVDDSVATTWSASDGSRVVVDTTLESVMDPSSAIGTDVSGLINLSISQVNDAPQILDLAVDGAFLEFTEAVGVNVAGIPVRLDSLTVVPASISDVELTERGEADFGGARLVIQGQGTADLLDLYVVETGNGLAVFGGFTSPGSGITLFNSGSVLTYNGIVIGTVTDNSADSGQLVVTFNAMATTAAVNQVLRNIVYSSSDPAVVARQKLVDVTFFDGNTDASQGAGGELSATATIGINLIAVNDSPFFTQGATLESVEDEPATTAITWTALLSSFFEDPDQNLSSTDTERFAQLSGVGISAFDNQGLGEWQVSFDGTNWLNLSAVTDGISNARALLLSADTLIRFQHNENANTQGSTRPSIMVHAVEDDVPDGAPRTAEGQSAAPLTFSTDITTLSTYNLATDTAESRISTDGVTVDVSITARNDAPVLTAGAVYSDTLIESPVVGVGTVQQQLFFDVSVQDLDIATTGDLDVFGAGRITLTLAGRLSSDVFSLADNPAGVESITGNTGTGSFVIQLSNTATLAQVQVIIEAIRFESTSDNPSPETRSFNLVLNDGNNLNADGGNAGGPQGLDSSTLSGSITITGVNDPPLLTLTSNNPAYLENTTATTLFSNASIDTIQEPADNIINMSMTATGVLNDTDEKLTIDGTVFSLVATAATATEGGNSVTITESGGTLTITLTSSGLTEAQTATLINGLAYSHISDDPTDGDRVFTITSLQDDGGIAGGGEETRILALASTVDVVPVNDPADAQATVGGTFVENDVAIQFLTGITVTDLDSTQFNGGWLRVALDDYIAGDTLSIAEGNGITVDGNRIFFNSAIIGTFTGGAGVDLVINFTTEDATILATQALLRQLRYGSTSENPTWAGTAPTRAVTVSLDDGGNSGSGEGSASTDTSPITGTFNVAGINDAPTLTNLDAVGVNTYIQSGDPVVIYANAVLSDLDFEALNAGLGNWNGSTLTIARNSGASVDDIFAATESLSLTSGNVIVSGTTIGTFSNTAGTLAITFNINATTALVNTTLQSITYSNAVTAGALAYNTLELLYTFNDQNGNLTDSGTAGTGQDQGSGGQASVTATITMNINRLPVAVADANALDEGIATTDTSNVSGNVITGAGNTANEGADSDPDITAGGRDDTLVVSGIRVMPGDFTNVAANSTSSIGPRTLAGNYGNLAIGADGSYTYTLDNTLDAVQQLAVGESLADEYTYQLSDGQGGFNSATLTITINGTNDAPTITGNADNATLTETNAPLTSSGTLILGDVDRSNTVATEVLSVAIGAGSATGGLDLALLNNTDNALLNLMSVTGALNGTQITGSLVWTFNSAPSTFDYLNIGESLVFEYTIRVTDTGAHGSVSTDRVVTIAINGSNDAPVIAVVDGSNSVAAALTENDLPLGASGTLSVTDRDYTDTVSVAVTDVAVSGTGPRAGLALTDAELQAMLSVNSVAVIGNDTTGTINWSFVSNAGALGEAFNNLAAGETLILTYTITATDGNLATDTQTVVITITGTNDAPIISEREGDSIMLAIAETNTMLSDSGTLTVTDLDYSNTVTASVTNLVITEGRTSTDTALIPTLATLQNMLSVTPSVIASTVTEGELTWSFNSGTEYFNYLRSGETLELRYTITVSDGTATDTQDVTVTITGANDAPLLSIAPTNIAKQQDAAAQDIDVSGVLNLTDLDLGDTLSATQAAPSILWSGGAIPAVYNLSALTAADVLRFGGSASSTGGFTEINWTYNPTAVDLDWLALGETLTVTYPVTVSDGQGGSVTQNLVIVITDTNDAPTLQAVVSGSIADDPKSAALGATSGLSGTLVGADVDFTDTLTYGISGGTTGGSTELDSVTYDVSRSSAYGTLYLNSSSGQYRFEADAVAVNALTEGANPELTFTFTVSDGIADPVAQIYTINLIGANEVAVIGGTSTGTVVEAGVVGAGTPEAAGTLIAANVDDTDNAFQAVVTATASDSGYGTFVATAAGVWTYTLDNANATVQALNAGQTLTDSFKVLSKEGTSQLVTITIQGANDAAVIGGDTSASVIRGAIDSPADTQVSGALTAADVDNPHNLFLAASGEGAYGSWSIGTSGFWVYTLDGDNPTVQALAPGESLTDSFIVRSADGTPQVITVTVMGRNDAATIIGNNTGTVLEDAVLDAVTGTLTVLDPNPGQAVFQEVGPEALSGVYGEFVFDSATGAWVYTLDNGREATQALAAAEVVTETLTVTSLDGSASDTITITINGVNDAAVIGGKTAASLVDTGSGESPSTVGTLTASDIDNPDNVFQPDSGQASYGVWIVDSDGSWQYTLNPDSEAVQALGFDEILQDSFVVRSQDGTEALITIEIVGGRVDDSVFVPLPENQPGLGLRPGAQDDSVVAAAGDEGDVPAIGESVLVIDTILGGVGTNYESFVNESIVVDDQFFEDQQTTAVLRAVLRPLDRLLTTTQSLSFQIQSGTFIHSDPAASLELGAALVDGSPLPDWIHFDSASGEFTVVPPADLDIELQVKVTATDGAGNQASVDFLIRIKITDTDAETEVNVDSAASSVEAWTDRMVGKPALSAQFVAETETNVLSSALGFIAQLADLDNYTRTDKKL